MITSNPAILRYASETIRTKLIDLSRPGFSDPVKVITSLPAVVGYAIDKIRGKIADLRDLGFADPVKMITTFPALMGYARERLLLCGKIIKELDEDGTEGMFKQLIKKPRAVIDAVAVSRARTWAEVRAVMAAVKSRTG
jgi:hypothetical protein